MKKRICCYLASTIILLSGCVSGDGLPPTRIIADLKGVELNQYKTDLYQCRQYAAQIDVGGDAVTGLLAGALVGAAIGSVLGDKDDSRRTAKVGAVAGITEGAASAISEQDLVIRNCLVGRGYKVLN